MPRPKKKTSQIEKTSASPKTPRTLRGMRDILPTSQKYWEFLREKTFKIAQAYSFERIDTPLLEETSLFKRTIGSSTDIVEKEMFSFLTPAGEDVSLRPENTAPLARAYIEHGMVNLPQPVKLYYLGPMFRYSRPQKGRFRQFHQVGFEILGDEKPISDAQIITVALALFQELGLPEISFEINSIGCLICRKEYKKDLLNFLSTKKRRLCQDCQHRLEKNPLRTLDCKNPECRLQTERAPQLLDFLCPDCHEHFVKVLEHLDEVEIPYVLNPKIVRGLDYYTKTTFEIWSARDEIKREGTKESYPQELGGGGRYDGLIESLGGRPTPGCGIALGIERIISQLRERELLIPELEEKPDILLAQLGETARKKALRLFENLRKQGFRIRESLAQDGLKAQLERANKLGVKFSLILGQKEVLDKTIIIRDMESGVQEIVDMEKVGEELKKRLEK